MQIKPPSTATHWALHQVTSASKNGKNHGKLKRMTGDPAPDGQVVDMWPVSEWSPARVLAVWGPGRYRVSWYDGSGALVPDEGRTFEVAEPPGKAKGPRLTPRRQASEGDTEPAPAPAPAPGSIGLFEMLAMLREERAEARREAEERAERDRQFLAAQQQTLVSLVSALGGGGRGGAAPDMDLLRREMRVTLQESTHALRREVGTILAGVQQQQEDERDDEDGPEDLEDAGNRILMSVLGEVEQSMPGMVQEAIPAVVAWVKSKGGKLSPELERKVREHAAGGGRANGA